LEHTPIIRDVCGTLYIWAKKPQYESVPKPMPQLAAHETLFGSTSVVVPCHNEEMNVRPLVNAVLQMYGKYLREIILVNDNSTDGTAETIRAMSEFEPRVKLLDRKPPAGVGRALREGCAAASGRYILIMDCDFVQIAPELRDLFDAIASGHDGAIGSRFSHESVLINYPVGKVICNRGFHLLMNLLLWKRMRDISNNLKLMRADILKSISIEENHFAANVETGLKPILAGYDIKEVPISWVNRTTDMGQSSFGVLRVAPRYAFALLRIVWNARVRRTIQRPAEELKRAATPR
jgi:glycosyltransferase involved in cell wall biosynthesis